MAASELVATGDEAAGAAETEPEGACGWSKHQVSVELGGGQADVRAFFYRFVIRNSGLFVL